MKKRCFLVGQKDSLFKEVVATLLMDSTNNLFLYESQAVDFEGMLAEVLKVEPDVILLDESSPFTVDSFLMQLLITNPGLPVIVISEDDNLMHVVHRETIEINSSMDLINTINLI